MIFVKILEIKGHLSYKIGTFNNLILYLGTFKKNYEKHNCDTGHCLFYTERFPKSIIYLLK